MAHALSQHLVDLLREVVAKRHAEMIDFVDPSQPLQFTEQQRFQLRQSLTNELCETGLKDDDEPNQRGYYLEALIDWLGKD